MVGIYGTIGTDDEFDRVKEHFFFTREEHQTEYEDNDRSIHAVLHEKKEAKSQPIEVNNVHIFIWGEICGFGNLSDYKSRNQIGEKLTDAGYCAKLYKENGLNFIDKLNSNFAGVIFDNNTSETHIFTDRLGSRPLYYLKKGSSMVFSTSLQAVVRHSDCDKEFHKDFLCQYLTFYKVIGIYTPFKDVKKVPPGSILTFDHKTGEIKQRVYWKPLYRPKNNKFKNFVDWFIKIFDDVMQDRLDIKLNYGLLLSGGSDSRLIANYIKGKKGFHMNDATNREARLAKKIAKSTGNDFIFLKRDDEYYPRLLDTATPLMNFNSPFKSAQCLGFAKELQDVDIILSGQYADALLSGFYIPKTILRFPFIKHLFKNIIPKKIDSDEDFFKYLKYPKPDYIDFNFQLEKSIKLNDDEDNLSVRRINFGDVYYPGLDTLINYWPIYPLTNAKSILFYESLNQIGNTFYPYLDNRIIDFSQYLPIKYKIRRDVVKNALTKKNQVLSRIIHPNSLQPLYRHDLIHTILKNVHSKIDSIKHHMEGQGSWPDYDDIMSKTGYAQKVITDNKDVFESFSYLNYEKALSIVQNDINYRSVRQIHSLITFLKIYNKIHSI